MSQGNVHQAPEALQEGYRYKYQGLDAAGEEGDPGSQGSLKTDLLQNPLKGHHPSPPTVPSPSDQPYGPTETVISNSLGLGSPKVQTRDSLVAQR